MKCTYICDLSQPIPTITTTIIKLADFLEIYKNEIK